jgi:hypothetical protein
MRASPDEQNWDVPGAEEAGASLAWVPGNYLITQDSVKQAGNISSIHYPEVSEACPSKSFHQFLVSPHPSPPAKAAKINQSTAWECEWLG